MWKDYSRNFIKNNRASSTSIMVAALIATLFLSFLSSIFYNFWVYDIENIVIEEGDWQGRITGDIDQEDLLFTQSFGNVKKAVVNADLSSQSGTVVDLYFQNPKTIFQDIPLLIKQLGLEENKASYHITLLSRYLIHDPKDADPPLLLTFYLAILIMVSLSLILIIRNSFVMSMDARIHQFGIFKSIGATPAQIRTCLLQEAAVLCLIPVFLGSLLGIGFSFGVISVINLLTVSIPGNHTAVFHYHPLAFIITIVSSVLTILFSAWLPARKLSKLSPLEAIRNSNEFHLKKKKGTPVLSLIFGIEGELAGNALKAQRKALRTSTLSLTLSFLGFTLILCFFTLSNISTKYTYFERYQDSWDVMVTVKNTNIEDLELLSKLEDLKGIKDYAVYQKAEAISLIPEEAISRELITLGGLKAVAPSKASKKDGSFLVNSPIVVLNDSAFLTYCEQIGIAPKLDGGVVLNQIWDSLNSNFRYPAYVPFIDTGSNKIHLQSKEGKLLEIPVIGYAEESPVLKEEYDNYSLVNFMPLSVWNTIKDQVGGASPHTYIRILLEKGAPLAEFNNVEKEVVQLLGKTYDVESENRIQDKITNDYMILGYQILLGGLCFLLAMIGIANVFSNTLGFLRQRKQEFAQYMSVGMTPFSLRKMLCIEALVIASRPFFITLPLTVVSMGYMIKASYLDPMEFIQKAPLVPIFAFILIIFLFVTLAYYLGGRKVMRCTLSDALRDDTAM